nr:immunoglobulin light chain junction region [Macaca mulatta]
CLQYKSDPYTF